MINLTYMDNIILNDIFMLFYLWSSIFMITICILQSAFQGRQVRFKPFSYDMGIIVSVVLMAICRYFPELMHYSIFLIGLLYLMIVNAVEIQNSRKMMKKKTESENVTQTDKKHLAFPLTEGPHPVPEWVGVSQFSSRIFYESRLIDGTPISFSVWKHFEPETSEYNCIKSYIRLEGEKKALIMVNLEDCDTPDDQRLDIRPFRYFLPGVHEISAISLSLAINRAVTRKMPIIDQIIECDSIESSRFVVPRSKLIKRN